MANYRFYRLDKDDHVTEPPHIFEGPDDDAAVEQAVQLLNEQVIEVWDHSRLVSRLEPDKGLDPTFVSPAAIWMNGVLSSGNVCDPQNK